jgi:putative MATE family efflux protein
MEANAKGTPESGILRKLLSLSWPLTVSETLAMLVPTIDMVWIGKLGAEAIAGVGIAGTATAVVMSSISGITTGLRATVARLTGSNEQEAAAHMVKQAFVFALLYTLLIAIAGALFSRSLLTALGLDAKAVDEGGGYLRLMLMATPLFTFRVMTETTMQASGDAVTPMKITVFHRILHAVLSPLLVFGWLSFPKLGVSGVAWAPIISQSIALLVALWVLSTGRTKLRLTLTTIRIVPRDIWRLVKISIPTAIGFTQNDLGQMVIGWIMIPYGTVAVAAHVLSRRIEMVLFMPISGLGLASGILTGQYLGIKRPDVAAKNGWLSAGIATAIGVTSALAVLLFAGPIVRIFNTEPALVAMGTTFARIGCISYAVIGVIIIFLNCLNGAGDTVPPMLILFTCLWLVGIPLVYFLPRFAGITVFGVRWMLQSIAVLTAIAMTAYFRSGRWTSRSI